MYKLKIFATLHPFQSNIQPASLIPETYAASEYCNKLNNRQAFCEIVAYPGLYPDYYQ